MTTDEMSEIIVNATARIDKLLADVNRLNARVAILESALRDCGQALEDAIEYCRWPAGKQNLDAIVERGEAARALAVKVLAP
jgi:hypothetical protein